MKAADQYNLQQQFPPSSSARELSSNKTFCGPPLMQQLYFWTLLIDNMHNDKSTATSQQL